MEVREKELEVREKELEDRKRTQSGVLSSRGKRKVTRGHATETYERDNGKCVISGRIVYSKDLMNYKMKETLKDQARNAYPERKSSKFLESRNSHVVKYEFFFSVSLLFNLFLFSRMIRKLSNSWLH